jgi:hypothetical protein
MQNLTFDAHGYLTPSEKITIDLNTLEQVFVKDFPNSTRRKVLFDNYLRYVDAFAKEITPHFTQWINGSFVTRKENPKDIDFVTFLNSYTDRKNIEIIDRFQSFSLENENLDAYILEIYPTEDEKYLSYSLMNLEKWDTRFSYTKEHDDKIIFPKGYIEILYK